MGVGRKDGARLLSEAHKDRMTENGHGLEHEKTPTLRNFTRRCSNAGPLVQTACGIFITGDIPTLVEGLSNLIFGAWSQAICPVLSGSRP